MQDIVRNTLGRKYYVVDGDNVVLITEDLEAARSFMMNNYEYDS